jgi:hypothetical protein
MVGELFQIPGEAQTPDEIEDALQRSGADASLAAQVKTALAQCDDIRYGRDAPGSAGLRAQLQESVERLMQSPRWVAA